MAWDKMGIRNRFVEKGKTEGFGGREIGGFVNVKVKEGCRLQATGYRELLVYDYDYVYEKREIGGFVNVKVNVNDGTGDADAGVFDAGSCQTASRVAG